MSKLDVSELEEFVFEEDQPVKDCGYFETYNTSEEFFPCNEDQFCNVEEKKCISKSEKVDPSYMKFPLDKDKELLFFGKKETLQKLGKKYKEIKIKEFDEKDKERLERIRNVEEAAKKAIEESENLRKIQQEKLEAEQKVQEALRLERIKAEIESKKIEEVVEQEKEIKKDMEEKVEREEKPKFLNKTLTRTRLFGMVFHRLNNKYLKKGIEAKDLYEELYKEINIGKAVETEVKTIKKINDLIELFMKKSDKGRKTLLATYPDIEISADIEIDFDTTDIKEVEEATKIPISKTDEVEVKIDGEEVKFSRYTIMRLLNEMRMSCSNKDSRRFTIPLLLEISNQYRLGIKEEDTKYRKPYYKKEDLCNEVMLRLQNFLDNLPQEKIDLEQEKIDSENFNNKWKELKKASKKLDDCKNNFTIAKLKQLVKDYNLDIIIRDSDKKDSICSKVSDVVKEEYRKLREITKQLLSEKEEVVEREVAERPVVLVPSITKPVEIIFEEEKETKEEENVREAKLQAEREAKLQAEREAKLQAEKEAKLQAEKEAKERELLEEKQKLREEDERLELKDEEDRKKKEQEELQQKEKAKERQEIKEEKIIKKETKRIRDVIDKTVEEIKYLRSEGRLEYELYKLPRTVAICTGLSV
jgi:hypothetical protein